MVERAGRKMTFGGCCCHIHVVKCLSKRNKEAAANAAKSSVRSAADGMRKGLQSRAEEPFASLCCFLHSHNTLPFELSLASSKANNKLKQEPNPSSE